jgi:predicted nucleic acid-binding protein
MVTAEGHGWFLKRYDRYRAMQFLAMVEAMPFQIVAVGEDDQSAAIELLRRFSDQDLTLVDAVGLHLMASRRAASCWSTDFHLGVTGVPLVIHGR